MKIIINGRFLIHRITGVERYAREIIYELDKIVPKNKVCLAVPPETTNLPKLINIDIVKIGKLHNRLWEHLSFPLYVIMQRAISLNLCNVAPILAPGIVCIHDVKVAATPQFFSEKFLLWYKVLFANATKRAKKIITVSNFSKKEIIKYYKVNEKKICVIPSSWEHIKKISFDDTVLKKNNLVKYKYFFSMSSLEPNKNFKWIAECARKNPQYTFVVAGSINNKVFSDGLDFKCPSNMLLTGYISDEEAKSLEKYSYGFLFPTLYEGFGLPPLEAIGAGCNTIVLSDTEVMHEIYGNSANYINPNVYELDFSNLKKIDDAQRILNRFTWGENARLLLELLEPYFLL